jgi:hypothetical protein
VRRRMPVHRDERQTSLGHGVGQPEFVAHVGLKVGRPEGFRHLAILPASGSRHTCSGRDACVLRESRLLPPDDVTELEVDT